MDPRFKFIEYLITFLLAPFKGVAMVKMSRKGLGRVRIVKIRAELEFLLN